MKIKCSGCDAAEAKVFCCADEAALCLDCDEKIHSANKLVSKHHRVPLSTTSSSFPKCDICQETFGYFICLEDRAVLCRKCDVSIHTINSCVRRHPRFLLGGVRVGLESAGLDKSSGKVKLQHSEKVSASAGADSSTRSTNNIVTISARDPKVAGGVKRSAITPPDSKDAREHISERRFKDILELIDPSNNPSSQEGVFKATEGKGITNSEWWNILRSTEEELLNDNSQTSNDISWTVPQLLPQYSASSPQGEQQNLLQITTFLTFHILEIYTAVNDFQFYQNPMNAKLRNLLKRKAA